MPTIRMTDAAVQRLLAAPGQRIEYFDAATGGLCLRVAGPVERTLKSGKKVLKEGRRSWCLYYRHGGKLARLTLGQYPALKLSDARAEANKATRLREIGEDPRAAKREAKAAAARKPHTLGSVVDEFIKRGLEGRQRAPRYVEEVRRNFDNHVLPRWGADRAIQKIIRRDVIELLDAIKDDGSTVRRDGKRKHLAGGPIAANRTLAAIRALFNFAIRRGIMETSPVMLMERPGAETKRDRVLNADEIRTLWSVAEAMGPPFGVFFRLCLLLGQRRSEVAGMRWGDLDLTEGTWTLAADATKAGRTHVVPLPPLAVELLNGMPRLSANAGGRLKPSPYVFTTEGHRPISGFSPAKARLEKAVALAAQDAGRDPPAPWTIHDLRRTCGTELGRLGVSRFIIGKVLNHSDHGVTAVYDRYEYLPEKRHALGKWAQYLSSLTEPPAGNVVTLRQAAAP
jgi:integrase